MEPTYYRTCFGQTVEYQSGPDDKGWITVKNVKTGAISVWNSYEMTRISAEEAKS